MARPQKEGLGYFPMDVDIDQDDKLIVPIAKHGMAGFGVIVKFMMEIYRNGYYYPWTEKERYVFPFKIGMDTEKVSEIIKDCVTSGFFDKRQFEKNQILTSYGFQQRFLLAASRRKESVVNERFKVEKGLFHTETELMRAETSEMSVISTQSKVKESKVNEIKEEDIKPSSRNKKTAYSEDDDYYQMAMYFHHKIKEVAELNNKAHLIENADLQKWADDFRKLLEIDKRDLDELKNVIVWSTADPFWQLNILSPAKLRKQYVTLAMKMNAAPALRSSQPTNRQQRNQEQMDVLQAFYEEGENHETNRDRQAVGSHQNRLP